MKHIEADGATVFDHARRMGLEGIVSKRIDAPYRSCRSGDWIKAVCNFAQTARSRRVKTAAADGRKFM
jgi:bifunctional non-homologous end joining protein LigD